MTMSTSSRLAPAVGLLGQAALFAASCLPATACRGTPRAVGGPNGPIPIAPSTPAPPAPSKRVILFVWDGLRPDSITEEDTPRLSALAREGALFPDHHATFPTYTMVNAASLATGGGVGTTGLYGNWLWQPSAPKLSPSGSPLLSDGGAPLRYDAPVFLENYAVVRDLDAFYGGNLLRTATLFERARSRGLTTAVVGKSGPAYLQDRHQLGYVLDERSAWPPSLVDELLTAGVGVPKTTAGAYPQGAVRVDAGARDPTAIPPSRKLADGVTTDPADDAGAPAYRDDAYLMGAFAGYILPVKRPELSLVWLRNPDTAEHWYGPGTPNMKQALRDMDELLGAMLDKVASLGWSGSTDVVVVSDHGHSTVSGPLATFPLRTIGHAIGAGRTAGDGGTVGARDATGYSVSGDVRLADLLTRVGGFSAFDGLGCLRDPVLSGITADGGALYPARTDDARGTACGKDPKTGRGALQYNTPAYVIPDPVPASAVVVAVNGGSDYLYLPSHDARLMAKVVAFLQGREEIGPIFVASHYHGIPGTLPMAVLGIEGPDDRRAPDAVVGYDFDEEATVSRMRGIEYAGAQNYRGMHGSFSPVDVRATLVAWGPDFRRGFVDSLPTGNVDVAPTVARILGLALPGADGRPIEEALAPGLARGVDYRVETPEMTRSDEATGLRVFLPTDTDGTHVDHTKTKYRVVLKTRRVEREGESYTYFDWARGMRD